MARMPWSWSCWRSWADQPIPPLVFDPVDGMLVDDVAAFVDGGEVLRDDYAPVEQLAANP